MTHPLQALQVSVEGPIAESLSPEVSFSLTLSDAVAVAALYLLFYLQRHLYLLQQLGAVGIQWDRGLFVDI